MIYVGRDVFATEKKGFSSAWVVDKIANAGIVV